MYENVLFDNVPEVNSEHGQPLLSLDPFEVTALTNLEGDGAVLPDGQVALQGLQITSEYTGSGKDIARPATDNPAKESCAQDCPEK
jgi:hypothetical protein